MRTLLTLLITIIIATAPAVAQLPSITDSARVKLIQGDVTWLTRMDSLKVYMNVGGGSDGNGIYSGDGTVPSGTNATLISNGSLTFDYSNAQPAISLNDISGTTTVSSRNGLYGIQATNSAISASGGGSSILVSGISTKLTSPYTEVNGGSNGGRLRFTEPSFGANYTQFEAGSQSTDISYVWPTTAGSPGQYLQYGSSGQLGWVTDPDESVTNEGQLSVGAGGGNSSTINSNTSGSSSITIAGGSNVTVTESGSTITIAASGGGGSPDGNGIYSGSDTIPPFTTALVDNFFSFNYDNATESVVIDDLDGTVRLYDKTGVSNVIINGDSIGIESPKTIIRGDTLDVSNVTTLIGFPSGGGGGSPTVITPVNITVNQNNYNPTGWATATIIRISGDSLIRGFTGFESSGIADGAIKKLINVGSYPMYIAGQHPSSTDTNRVYIGCDYIMHPKSNTEIMYDSILNRWVVLTSELLSCNTMEFSISPQSATAADYGDFTVGALNSGSVANAGVTGENRAGLSLIIATAANSGGSMYFPKTALGAVRRDRAHSEISAMLSISALSTGANDFVTEVRSANVPNTTDSTNNSWGLRYNHKVNSGNWTLFCRNNSGVEVTFDTGIAVQAAKYYVVRVYMNKENTEIRAYINDEYAGLITPNFGVNNFFNSTGVVMARSGAVGTTSVSTIVHMLKGKWTFI
jgi:hypothetical protein